ncbi:hypothetical protein Bbelb_151990 [Branchiostoma belcheri]|nr:hypothetical protein Bbelb_151990 [Branchiostoma belcheri]
MALLHRTAPLFAGNYSPLYYATTYSTYSPRSHDKSDQSQTGGDLSHLRHFGRRSRAVTIERPSYFPDPQQEKTSRGVSRQIRTLCPFPGALSDVVLRNDLFKFFAAPSLRFPVI